jgi:hypothetical protein
MATSRCPRSDCTSTSFELKEIVPRGSEYKLLAVQCTSCGAVVGVLEYFNSGQLLHKLAEKLGVKL